MLAKIAALMLVAIFCRLTPAHAQNSRAAQPAIVPRPAKIELQTGEFLLTPATAIVVMEPTADARAVADYLAERLAEQTGSRPDVGESKAVLPDPPPDRILLTTVADAALGDEGYQLTVTAHAVTLRAPQARGLFRGVQTLRQLLSSETVNPQADGPAKAAQWLLPCVTISDMPRYRWRGMLLDCGRHFMPKEFVKRYIDLLAYHKMNVFHWHLTEDQGWRIEIKKYPKLTEIGAWRKATRDSEQPRDAQGRYGGFYTQDDIREIVAYAKGRHITVVPEIELPGHCRAALASYPELGCTGGPYQVRTEWGVEDDVYCAGNEKTFEFLQDVLGEALELFPSEFIHIGGDEVPKEIWRACPKCQARMKAEGLKNENELQSYFIKRVEKFLNSKGRRLIGWDEILEGGLAPNATVQSWRGMDGAIAASTSGHDVISSPNSHCYLDHAQGHAAGEPRWMGFAPLEKTYSFEPTPAQLTPEQAKHILGIEGNMWTEYAPPNLIDRQVFPRLCAIAEIGWSPREARDIGNFTARMQMHYPRLDALGVKYYVHPPLFIAGDTAFTDSTTLALGLSPLSPMGSKIHYTLDGSEPTPQATPAPWPHTPGAPPLKIEKTTTVKARTFLKNGHASGVAELNLLKLKRHEAVKAGETKPGLAYAYSKGQWNKLPDFSKLAPRAVGVAPRVDISQWNGNDVFAVRFTGYLEVAQDGVYTFSLVSDDGSRLRIGDEVVVDHDGLHSASEKSGKAILGAGKHPFTVEMFELGGSERLEVYYEGPGIARQLIPAAAFSVSPQTVEELNQRKTSAAATPDSIQPTPRAGDAWWEQRHAELNRRAKQDKVDLVFIGDSITQGWEDAGKAAWEKYYAPRNAINLGISGDRTQHVLWRLANGHLDGLAAKREAPKGSPPKLVVMMIGTNNSNGDDNTSDEIALGIETIVKELRAKLPGTKILLLAIFPRGEKPNPQREKIAAVNQRIARLADGKSVQYLDIGPKFLAPDGALPKAVMPDFLHLSPRGYEIWAEAIEAKVKELLGG